MYSLLEFSTSIVAAVEYAYNDDYDVDCWYMVDVKQSKPTNRKSIGRKSTILYVFYIDGNVLTEKRDQIDFHFQRTASYHVRAIWTNKPEKPKRHENRRVKRISASR